MGFSLIHWAVICNQQEEISKLIEAGFAINETTGQFELRDTFKTFEFKWTPLYFAVKMDNLAIVNQLIHHKADVNQPFINCSKSFYPKFHYNSDNFDTFGNSNLLTTRTVLHVATKNGNLDLVRILVNTGAHVEMFSTERTKHFNFKTGKIYDLILSSDELISSWYTPLALASKYNHIEIGQFLMQRGKARIIPLLRSYHNDWQKNQLIRFKFTWRKDNRNETELDKIIENSNASTLITGNFLKLIPIQHQSPVQLVAALFRHYPNYSKLFRLNNSYILLNRYSKFFNTLTRHHQKAIDEICSHLDSIEPESKNDNADSIYKYLKNYYEVYCQKYTTQYHKSINPKGVFNLLMQTALELLSEIKDEQEYIESIKNDNSSEENSAMKAVMQKYGL